MIVSIMQPYFFPYLGYFQLIAQSGTFVFHDDVQYIKGGWINRNRILRDGAPAWITLPVLRDAHERAINQRTYQNTRANVDRTLRSIEGAYRKAPRFEEVRPLLVQIMSFEDANVAAFNINLVSRICRFLNIEVRLAASSEMVRDNPLIGQDRVIDLCRRVGGTRYVNPVGGMDLYQVEAFARADISLGFLEPRLRPYAQFGGAHVTALSIIDVLMFNSNAAIAEMLEDHRLSPPLRASAPRPNASPSAGRTRMTVASKR
jgi:hypothetical protein